MRYPEFLKENGTIGFAAPAFGCATEPYKSAFDNALKTFEKMGHKVFLGENCYAGLGIGISNKPSKCAKELTEVYTGSDCDAIISVGGGELMCETIGELDFEKIKQAKPKWFMGYSDNTNFVFLNTILCDTAGIYGPCANEFGMEPWHEAITDAYNLMCGKNLKIKGYDLWEKDGGRTEEEPLLPYNLTEKKILKYGGTCKGDEASFSGRLIGGCLDCLENLCGTKYDKVEEFAEKYKEDGIVWFIEACDFNVMSIRRAMWHLKNAGWFKYTRGFLIGRPYFFGQEIMGLDQYKAVLGVVEDLNVPVIMDCDIGHLSPMMPLICGSYAEINAKANDITVDMKLI
ncbi:MAG: LD-carboxypeptidase [Lachnospiraceae bacterium]|nr:LD-carboxypeptidase [Lachnospiraceae bacterium]